MKILSAIAILGALTTSVYASSLPGGSYSGQTVGEKDQLAASAEIGAVASTSGATRYVGAFHFGATTLPFADGAYENGLLVAQITAAHGEPVGVVNCSSSGSETLRCSWQSLRSGRVVAFSVTRNHIVNPHAFPIEELAGTYSGTGSSAEPAREYDVSLKLSAFFTPVGGRVSAEPQLVGSIALTGKTEDAPVSTMAIATSHYDRASGELVLLVSSPEHQSTAVVEVVCAAEAADAATKLTCDWRSLLASVDLKIDLTKTQ